MWLVDEPLFVTTNEEVALYDETSVRTLDALGVDGWV